MNRKILFMIMVVAQLAVPARMIAHQEKVLEQGEVFKFRTAPVDPYDIFRGRYVALRTDQQFITLPANNNRTFTRNQTVYAHLKRNEHGLAFLDEPRFERPEKGAYLKLKALYEYENKLYFQEPFARFYMNEKKAPEAERLYRQRNRTEEQESFIQVKVLNGVGIIEDLYIDGKTVGSYF